MSVVGQHMQQAGATPAEAMAFTLSSTAVQNAEDCIAARHGPRRVPAALHLLLRHLAAASSRRSPSSAPAGASGPGSRASASARRTRRSWRFKFHAQTSGVDLTRQQPLNNIARVTAQAMAGIFGGLQSLHTDAYDEAYATPSEAGARIAVATQNILREEAHLTDVIDPLGGSFYVESLTDQMEEKIVAIMKTIDDAGGMYKAVEAGLVQRMIGASAMRFQRRVEAGEQVDRRRQQVPGRRRRRESAAGRAARCRGDAAPPRRVRGRQGGALGRRGRQGARRRSRAPPSSKDGNVFGAVVDGARAGLTNEEICSAPAPRPRLRPAARHRLTVSRRPAAAHRSRLVDAGDRRRPARARAPADADRRRPARRARGRGALAAARRQRLGRRHHRRSRQRQVDAGRRLLGVWLAAGPARSP